jgi:glycosyltransferase involved in cell wall biosynthesis
MKIFYWAPFLSNIATVDAVLKSISSLNKYDKNKEFETHIIDAVGEWSQNDSRFKKVNIKKIYKKDIYKSLPKGSFLKSRTSQMIIFVKSLFNLKKMILKEMPDYFIAHLIISLPLLLFSIFNFKTRLVIRISGTPKLNFLRKFFWKLCSKKVYKVTCPTFSTYDKLKKLKIFSDDKLVILFDPVISVKEINKLKHEKIDLKFRNNNYILGIGRLTKQKNFQLLIKAFSKISKKISSLNLIILGEGEDRGKLEKLAIDLSVEDKVDLIGYKSNVFNYLYNAKCFISSSLYEDPGFVIIEAGFLNKIVFAADSKTGPSEILKMSKRGILYENKNYEDLVKKYLDSMNFSDVKLNEKKLSLKKYSSNFTSFAHFKNLRKILVN